MKNNKKTKLIKNLRDQKKSTKAKSPLKSFVVVVWDNDESGEYSPISFPVKAISKKEVEDTINEDKGFLNKRKLPDKSWFSGEYMPSANFKGKVYSLKEWSDINWDELDCSDDY